MHARTHARMHAPTQTRTFAPAGSPAISMASSTPSVPPALVSSAQSFVIDNLQGNDSSHDYAHIQRVRQMASVSVQGMAQTEWPKWLLTNGAHSPQLSTQRLAKEEGLSQADY